MRVAVIAGGDPGHVFPAAGLTSALGERGHQALLCTGKSWLPALHRDGVPAIAMPPTEPNPEQDGFRRLRQTALQLAPQIAERLTPFAPELVVSDVMTLAGGLTAGLLGVPWVQLIPHPVMDPSRYLPPSSSGLAPARTALGRLRDERLYRIVSAYWRLGDAARERDHERLGLPRTSAAPRARLFASLPALEAPRPDWPRDSYLVGPLEWDPTDTVLTPPPGDGPLVLLSATTVQGAANTLAEATLAGLAGSGVRVAWTVFSPPTTALPGWVAAGPGRQEPLIEQAAAVICGGGHGILAKALSRGRPVVTVPDGGEQRENADRVRRAGLGVEILPKRLTPKRLAHAVHQVLTDPQFARAAETCQLRPDERGSGDRAVDVVEALFLTG
jgi:UDP:flavonoid glycosyltransferase YjiC (YdhE family)